MKSIYYEFKRDWFIWLSIFFVIFASLQFVECQTIEGNIVKYYDADTVRFRTKSGKYYRVRLQGIDAPERRQTGGLECMELLRSETEAKKTFVMFYGADSYKRMLGVLSTEEIPNLNLFLLQQGCAWEYSAPISLKTAYQNAEADAREAEIGLWAEPCPTEPWAFRASGYNTCE